MAGLAARAARDRLNTVDRLRLLVGETVVVLGQGPIGLALTRLRALSGAERLIVTDASEAPFEVSRAYGASDCLDVTQVDPREAVLELTSGARRHRIETLGFPSSSAMVPDLVRKKARSRTSVGPAICRH